MHLRQVQISARFEPEAPDPQLFSPTGEKFENWGPKNTISLREMCNPGRKSWQEILEILAGNPGRTPAQPASQGPPF